MPEDIQPPKTIEEVGIHLVYMAKAQNDTNASLREVKQTLKDMQSNAVSRADFDEHVIWGKDIAESHDRRIKLLEDKKTLEDASVWTSLRKRTLDVAVNAIAVAIIFGVLFFIVKTSTPDVTQLIK